MSTISFTQVSQPAEIGQILDLQAKNHPTALDTETMASQGFVTVRHDPDVLRRMNESFPSVLAKDGERVVGYALVMEVSFFDEVPILAPMNIILQDLSWKGRPLRDYRWFVMGQVCINESYRGQGVFDGMFRKMRDVCQPHFDFTVTEVAERNVRSMRAHERVGFELLHTYQDDTTGETWYVIIWDFRPNN